MFKLAVAGLFLVLALIASGVEAQELKRITMGYPSLAFTQSHIWVGKEQGSISQVRRRGRSGIFARRAGGDAGVGGGRAADGQRRYGDPSQSDRL